MRGVGVRMRRASPSCAVLLSGGWAPLLPPLPYNHSSRVFVCVLGATACAVGVALCSPVLLLPFPAASPFPSRPPQLGFQSLALPSRWVPLPARLSATTFVILGAVTPLQGPLLSATLLETSISQSALSISGQRTMRWKRTGENGLGCTWNLFSVAHQGCPTPIPGALLGVCVLQLCMLSPPGAGSWNCPVAVSRSRGRFKSHVSPR